jgi:hypothetical protein
MEKGIKYMEQLESAIGRLEGELDAIECVVTQMEARVFM